MHSWLACLCLCFFFCVLLALAQRCGARFEGYNIALHAQVIPTAHKVVGSAITTQGMQRALQSRAEVRSAEIFYPGQYSAYLDTAWDLVVVEGWFLGLAEFVHVTRTQFPQAVVVFYCLDPSFPSLAEILQFDVDGILTNSELVRRACAERAVPSVLVSLAADPEAMRPLPEIARDWHSVYVGAGGPMLEQKPRLFAMLVDAMAQGRLRLHGTHWDGVPLLQQVWGGTLPQDQLAEAYSSAEIVLTSTIASQDAAGMINNRLFEALACGSIVLSDPSPTLERVFADTGLVDFYRNQSSVASLLEKIRRDASYAAERRARAREYILAQHTWNHRAVQIMDFFAHLRSLSMTNSALSSSSLHRTPTMRLLWVESERVRRHVDYTLVVRPVLWKALSARFRVTTLTEEQWIQAHAEHCSDAHLAQATPANNSINNVNNCVKWLSQYAAIFAAISPFDAVDVTIESLPPIVRLVAQHTVQRRFGYMLGVDETRVRSVCQERMTSFCGRYTHFDVLFHRSSYEFELLLDLLSERSVVIMGSGETQEGEDEREEREQWRAEQKLRAQHLFGVPTITDNSTHHSSTEEQPPQLKHAFVCVYTHWRACLASERAKFRPKDARNESDLLFLFGASFPEWLALKVVISNVASSLTSTLSNVVHISEGFRHDELHLLLQDVDKVFVMTQGSVAEGATTTTFDDTLFPFVLPAVLGKRLHLSAMNTHLFTLAEDGSCTNWDNTPPSPYVSTSVMHGLHRAFGMPPRRTDLSFTHLILSEDSPNKCRNCDPEQDKELLQSGILNFILHDYRRTVGLLRMDYHGLEIGKDGLLCVNNPRATIDEMLCMLRSMKYLLLTLPEEFYLAPKPFQQNFVFDLRFSLRGSMFGDLVMNSTVSVPPSMSTGSAGKKPFDHFRGEILHEMLVYSYPLM